jgi:hypothetical protein
LNSGPRLALPPTITLSGTARRLTEAKVEKTMTLRLCLWGSLMLMAAPLGAGEQLALRVSPAVSFAPANLIVRATVEANAANRAMEVVAESADFYRASMIELEGEKAPRTNMFEFRSLPPGTYEVKATLIGSDGHPRAHVRQEVNVMGSGAR